MQERHILIVLLACNNKEAVIFICEDVTDDSALKLHQLANGTLRPCLIVRLLNCHHVVFLAVAEHHLVEVLRKLYHDLIVISVVNKSLVLMVLTIVIENVNLPLV